MAAEQAKAEQVWAEALADGHAADLRALLSLMTRADSGNALEELLAAFPRAAIDVQIADGQVP